MQRQSRGPLFVLMALFVVVMLRTAWVSDDAYISFRCADNFVNGLGLTWNVSERVQAFTNPLWTLLAALGLYLTGDVYYCTIGFSIVLSGTTVALIAYRFAPDVASAMVALALCLVSKAFVDFSTSGLENPLSYLFLTLFLGHFLFVPLEKRRYGWLGLLAGLGMFNRLDSALLFLPTLGWAWLEQPSKQRLLWITSGFTPVVVWHLFAFSYYGFLFPNTAYAKLLTGISTSELFPQALYYFLHTVEHDPITLTTIFAGILLPFYLREWRTVPVSISIALHILYVLRVGGDYMSGRFFTLPFLASVMVILMFPFKDMGTKARDLTAAIFLFGFISPEPILLSGERYGSNGADFTATGVVDERAYYYPTTGLLRIRRDTPLPSHPWRNEGTQEKATQIQSGKPLVLERYTIGIEGFYAGPGVHIVDLMALADPLLARLPSKRMNNDWRPGHFERIPPTGYGDTLAGSKNVIAYPPLKAYYDKLSLVTAGSLFSAERIKTLLALNFGVYDNLLLQYVDPPFRTVSIQSLGPPRVNGTPWDAANNNIISEAGIRVTTKGICRARKMEISLDHNDEYELVFERQNKATARLSVPLLVNFGLPGLGTRTVEIPTSVQQSGFEAIKIVPVAGDAFYSLGHVLFTDSADGCQ